MEGTNFTFYPPFQQNHPGWLEIGKSVVPEGWKLAPSNTEVAAGFHTADRGRLLPSSGPRVAAGSPPLRGLITQAASAVLGLTHKGGPLACWEGGMGGDVGEDTCRGGRMTSRMG